MPNYGGNPWQAAANAYGSDLDQYNQIAMQGMNERANAPARLYQAFTQSYQAALDRQMQQAEMERRAQMEQARIDHMIRADEFNRERLLAQDERADKDRSAKFYQEVDQDFTGTPEEVKSYASLADQIGIKGVRDYFNSRKVAGTPARTENMAGEYPGEEGFTQEIPATPERYMRGTQYGLKADAAAEANRRAIAAERLRAEESARRGEEFNRREERLVDEFGKSTRSIAGALAVAEARGNRNTRLDDESKTELAKRLVSGLEPWPTGRVATDPDYKEALQIARKLDPSYNASTAKNREQTQRAFTSGPQGQSIVAMNTAIAHLEEWLSSMKKLDNSDVRLWNQAKNKLKTETGDPTISAVRASAKTLADELTRAYRGVGGAEADIQAQLKNLDEAGSPAQAMATAKQLIGLLAGRQRALSDMYTKTMGKFGKLDVLTPESQGAIDRILGVGGKQSEPQAPNGTFWYKDKNGKGNYINDTPANRAWANSGGVF